MRFRLTSAALVLAGAPAWAGAPTKAVAVVRPTQNSSAEGQAVFTQTDKGLKVSVRVTGLAPGAHGFHVHEFGDCSAPDATSAGAHFNPTAEPHGGPHDAQRHSGDLGNIVADKDGVAQLEYVDPRASFEGPNSVLGRAVIVHVKADDMKTQPTGDAGGRLGCGVIGIVKAE